VVELSYPTILGHLHSFHIGSCSDDWNPSPCGRPSRPQTTMIPPTLKHHINRGQSSPLLRKGRMLEPPTFMVAHMHSNFRLLLYTHKTLFAPSLPSFWLPLNTRTGSPSIHQEGFSCHYQRWHLHWNSLHPHHLTECHDFGCFKQRFLFVALVGAIEWTG
jgi:hypothetical protein